MELVKERIVKAAGVIKDVLIVASFVSLIALVALISYQLSRIESRTTSIQTFLLGE